MSENDISPSLTIRAATAADVRLLGGFGGAPHSASS